MRDLTQTYDTLSTALSKRKIGLVIALSSSLLLTACPDPSGQYEAFNERRDETLAARQTATAGDEAGTTAGDEAGTTAGDEAGTTAGDEAGTTAGDEIPAPVPQIESGTYLFGLAPNLNVERPMTFVADVQIMVNDDRSGGQVLSIHLDPRSCEDFNTSAGDPVLFDPETPAEIGADHSFSANFGRVIVAGAANCISGSTIEADIQLDGRVSSAETLCGEMNGMLYRPYPADLGYSEITMERSTFGAMKIKGDEDINELSIPKNCNDIDQLLSAMGAEE